MPLTGNCLALDKPHLVHFREAGRSRRPAQSIFGCDYRGPLAVSRTAWVVDIGDERCISIHDIYGVTHTFVASLLSSMNFAARSFETLTSPLTLMIVDILAVTSSFF